MITEMKHSGHPKQMESTASRTIVFYRKGHSL